MNPTENASERLIVALDVDTKGEAMAVVKDLEGLVSFFKVGYQLFITEGLSFVKELIDKGKKVFLDLKMDDVEETIKLAVGNIAASDVEFLTIHGNGATARAALAGRGSKTLPKLLSVTFLSSLDAQDLKDLFNDSTMTLDQYITWRTEQAVKCGVEGLIASGDSVAMLRKRFPEVIIVTPGIRLAGTSSDDHKRFCTPAQAITAGADFLVVGRPIRNANDRRSAASKIIDEMEQALAAPAMV